MGIKSINKFIKSLIVIILIGLTTACSSSRRFARDPIYDAGKNTTQKKHKNDSKKTTAGNTKKLDASTRQLIDEAEGWLGTRYIYGGHSKSGTDCSGFVMEVYRNAANIKLPRTTVEQRNFCRNINFDKLDAGDLVFFTSRKGKGKVSHVGIYIGDGKMIHASSSRGVIISRLDEKYYVTNYHSSGRVGSFKKDYTPRVKPSGESKRPETVREVSVEMLDELLNQKLDSIYSGMMD